MNVTIDLDTREHIDLTNPPKLDNNTDIVLSQGRERDDFKRTVEDVKLRISDQVNELTNKFRAYPITSVWDVRVTDNARTLFQGRIERPISYNVKEDFLDVQCWSKNKDFWERAKITPIYRFTRPTFFTILEPGYGYYSYVELIVRLNCDLINGNNELFDTYKIDDLYRLRSIRFAWDVTDANIGNSGRYEDLDPKTTIYDLLTAFSKYYNAEIFIDAEGNQLVMQKRNIAENNTEYNLDELILNTEEIVYDDIDQKKYDYIRIAFGLPKPLNMYTEDGSGSGLPYHTLIYTLKTSDGTIESTNCNEYIPFLVIVIDPEGVSNTSKYKSFVIPNPPIGFKLGVLYKKEENGYKKVIDLSDENIATYPDIFTKKTNGLSVTTTPTQIHNWATANTDFFQNQSIVGNLYLRYDEATATWTSLFVDSNNNSPIGKIFDSVPQLKFIDPITKQTSETDFYWAFYFFGRETDYANFQNQWLEAFITRGKVSCTVKGLPYRVGDTFVTSRHPKIPAGKYVIKDAKNHLMREKTKLELIKA